MPATHETHIRQQGLRKTYDIEYTGLRYKISLEGKVLKEVTLPLQAVGPNATEDNWKSAVADIEFLRGMPEH
ncbi:MAG: hypothetical protein V4724_07175 [Pseudomonadota bacterium]